MIKNFNYKGITVRMKTNLLKDGKVYFGNIKMPEEIVSVYNEAMFEKKDTTEEEFLIKIYKLFLLKGIKPFEIIYNGLSNEGTLMRDISKQQTLIEE